MNPQIQHSIQNFWKVRFIGVFILVGICSVIGKLFYIQTIDSEKYKAKAQRQYDSRIELLPVRGNIYDRNENLIASNTQSISIAVDPKVIQNIKYVTSIIASVTNKKPSELERLIKKNSHKRFLWLARGISVLHSNKIDTLKDDGVIKIYEPKRNFVYGSVASQIIGTTDLDNKGNSGLELLLDSSLRGIPGFKILQRDGRGNLRPSVDMQLLPAVNGNTVTLTLDIDIQKVVEHELQKGIEETHAASGSVCIMDIHTGEVLAMASYPTFSPDKLATATFDAMRIRSITDTYEPGSTFKLITSAAALEEKIVTPNTDVDGLGGVLKYGEFLIKDSHGMGRVPFVKAVENSSNVIMATMAMRMSDRKFYKYVRDFGFGLTSGIDLPGELAGSVRKPERFDYTTKVYMAFGYQLSVTPFQMLQAYSTIANGGKMMKPYIVKNVKDPKGKIVLENKPQMVRQVVSEKTAKELTDMFTGVVDRGTGTAAQLPGVKIAGKTGTSQQLVNGKYSKQNYNASFCGFFPANDPKVAVMVMVDKPKTNIYGGVIAAPIFKRIAQYLVTVRGYNTASDSVKTLVAKSDSIIVPDLLGLKLEDAETIANRLGFFLKARTLDGFIYEQSPSSGKTVPYGSDILLRLRTIQFRSDSASLQKNNKDSSSMFADPSRPYVVGIPLRRAIAILMKTKVIVTVKGVGIVRRQYWTSGAKKTCILECSL
jgi:cell division protein FtsI (penicillin-binding protein 3)